MNQPTTSLRRLALAVAALSLWISAGGPASAAERGVQQAAFQAYTDAWSATADAARRQRLTDSLAPGMTYQDAMVQAEGVSGVDAMIARFQHQSPRVTLKLDDLMLWSDHGLARWSMLNPKGGLIMHGYDVVTYDPADRIKSIVGFFDIPGQHAAPPRP
jgi:hypothetical protein